MHARFTESEALRVARRMAPLRIYWWEEPTTRDRQEAVHSVAAASPIPVATGEMYDTVGQFFTLAERGGVNIFQPEPMSLGGISQHAGGRQSGAGAWQLHRAASERRAGGDGRLPAARRLRPELPDPGAFRRLQRALDARPRHLASVDRSSNGHLSLPDAPGLGIDLNTEVALAHPYDPDAFLNIFEEGWEKRLGSRGEAKRA